MADDLAAHGTLANFELEMTSHPGPIVTQVPRETGLVSEDLRETFDFINYAVLSTTISIFGIFSNVINVIVYWRIGFTESITVSLFALSVSDLGIVTLQIWTGLSQNPDFRKSSDLGTFLSEISQLAGGVQKISLARISVWITVLVTVERCMCIALPMKVKEILTPKRSMLVVAVCVICIFLSTIPMYISLYVGRRPVRGTNRTRLGVLRSSSADAMRGTTIAINLVIQFVSLFVIILSNCLLLATLQRQKRLVSLQNDEHLQVISTLADSSDTKSSRNANSISSKNDASSSITKSSPKQLATTSKNICKKSFQNSHCSKSTSHNSLQQMGTISEAVAQPDTRISIKSQQNLSLFSANNTTVLSPIKNYQSYLQSDQSQTSSNQPVKTHASPVEAFENAQFHVKADQIQQTLAPTDEANDNTSHPEKKRKFRSKPTALTRFSLHHPRESQNKTESPSTSAAKACGPKAVALLSQRRNWRVGKMVAILSLVLLLSYIPGTVQLVMSLIEPQFRFSGRYRRSFAVSWGFVTVLETLNASVNIFVYYNMSSLYRGTLLKMLSRGQATAKVGPAITAADRVRMRLSRTNRVGN